MSFHAVFASDTFFKTVYAQDSLGRITELIESIQGATRRFKYTYDLAGRLLGVNRNDTLIASYTYDSNGNRLSRITPDDTTAGTHDAQDRLLTYGSASYTYTQSGDLSMKIVGSDTTRYSYDAFGNLVSVRSPNGTIIEYVIDGQNRRVGKKVNGVLQKRWLYGNQLNIIAELDDAGNVANRFVYGARPNVPDYMIKGGVTYRIISDHLGSVRLVVNTTSGAVVQQMDYDEFGNIISNTNPGFQPFGFAGGSYDNDIKLVRFGARDYAPETGRWTAKDPIQFAGGDANLYVYVGNDPVNFIDPTGLDGRLCNRFTQDVVVVAFEQHVTGLSGIKYTIPGDARLLPKDKQTPAFNRFDPTWRDFDFVGVGSLENLRKGKGWYKFSLDAEATSEGTIKNRS